MTIMNVAKNVAAGTAGIACAGLSAAAVGAGAELVVNVAKKADEIANNPAKKTIKYFRDMTPDAVKGLAHNLGIDRAWKSLRVFSPLDTKELARTGAACLFWSVVGHEALCYFGRNPAPILNPLLGRVSILQMSARTLLQAWGVRK